MFKSLFSYSLTLILFFCFFNALFADSPFESSKNLPVSYQGRFRSLDSASRLWLYDTYHQQRLKNHELKAFHVDDASGINLLWHFHFLGHFHWDDAPFFWIHYASLKSLLEIESKRDRFSYSELYKKLYETPHINLTAVKILILSEFEKEHRSLSNRSHNNTIELSNLSPELWVTYHPSMLKIVKTPDTPPWHYLKTGMIISDDTEKDLKNILKEKNTVDSLLQLFQQLHQYITYSGNFSATEEAFERHFLDLSKRGISPSEIAQMLEDRFLFSGRLQAAGTTLNMLPIKILPGEWASLHAFNMKIYDPRQNQLVPTHNFTSFSNENFFLLREAYYDLKKAILLQDFSALERAADQFSSRYQIAYETLAGKPYRKSQEKFLVYPSSLRLQIETLYYRLPLIEIALMLYASVLIFNLIALLYPQNLRWKQSAVFFLFTAFILHTVVLIFRSYILQRPPVSNMFETVVYVPWIAVAIGLIFYKFTKSHVIIAAATLASFILLILLKLTQVDSRLENVQAVLDSQYWLIVHVLMVVGSYGAFAVSGILGHFYLLNKMMNKKELTASEKIAKAILHTMYVGIALLIPGTILGGIWAAESWGRFWDWDPKESWAFISACVYLLFVHAYTFQYIRDFGLAIGSIAGLIAISFTWYGVNYVLGTGLHSYGFGSGGEIIYFVYIALECSFILLSILLKNRHAKKLIEKN